MSLREHFPVLERLAYLNAGTDGPTPRAAVAAAHRSLDAQLEEGRHAPHFEARMAGRVALRAVYARLLRCEAADVALTTSTSEGLGKALAGMGLGPGDEILLGEREHPGLLGPVIAQRERGVRVRTAPIRRIAAAVTRATTVVACSHVGWSTGEVVDPAIAELDVPVILDGAQAAGAIDVEVEGLGCAAYAAAGQKWLCGADGTGMLYLAPAFRDRLAALGAGYVSFAGTAHGVDSPLHDDARRHDTPALGRESVAFTVAAARLLEDHGWGDVQSRGTRLAAQLARQLEEAGRSVAPRGDTTLVSWEDDTPDATAERLGAAGVVVRSFPGLPYVRASVGAWNDEGDLERLLAAL